MVIEGILFILSSMDGALSCVTSANSDNLTGIPFGFITVKLATSS